MSERRPHWDDDLVEAVRSKIGIHQHGPIGEIRIYNPFDDEVYNVIAAVEDWHKAKRDSRVRTHSEGCWRWHNECAESLIEWQQAAIQRVRGIVDADQTVPIDARDPASYVAGYADATFRVRQVLDGGQR